MEDRGQRAGLHVARIEIDGAQAQRDATLPECRGQPRREHQRAHAQEAVVRLQVRRADADDAGLLGGRQPDLERRHDLERDLVLDGEDVGELAVVAVGPEMPAGRRVDQLGGDAHPLAGAPHAALEHMADAQLPADHPEIDRLALVGEARVAGDDQQARHLAQIGDDVLADAVGEVLLLGVARHVVERQHRDRRALGPPLGRRCRGRGAWWCPGCRGIRRVPSPHLDRPGDVLDGDSTTVVENRVGAAAIALVDDRGNADAARLRQRLEPGRDVDAITVDVVALDDDVAEIDADPQGHDRAGFGLGRRLLDGDGAGHGIDHAAELDEGPVAHQLDDPAIVPRHDLSLIHI